MINAPNYHLQALKLHRLNVGTTTSNRVRDVIVLSWEFLNVSRALGNVLLTLAETQAYSAASVGGDGVCNSFRVLDPSTNIEVLDGVTDGVVVNIVCDTSLTTEKSLLLDGLQLLGTSEEASDGNTCGSEGGVVRSGGERSWNVIETCIFGEVVLEELFNRARSWWTRDVKSVSITIVNGVDVVWRCNHIEVEIQANFCKLGCVQRLDVSGGSHETNLKEFSIVTHFQIVEDAYLLSSPPSETNSVVDRVLCQVLGNLELSNGTRSVVIDTWSCWDRVGVSSRNNDVVLVTALCLSNDIGGFAGDSRDDKRSGGWAGLNLCNETKAICTFYQRGNWPVTLGTQGCASHASCRAVHDEHSSGTLGLGESSLDSKGTCATIDEDDLSGEVLGEVRLLSLLVDVGWNPD